MPGDGHTNEPITRDNNPQIVCARRGRTLSLHRELGQVHGMERADTVTGTPISGTSRGKSSGSVS